jgi:DNA uptake protein ComE-like DNA-binding protein
MHCDVSIDAPTMPGQQSTEPTEQSDESVNVFQGDGPMATKRLDINTASQEELAELPMIGDERAQILVQRRPFHDWSEIDDLPGFRAGIVEDIQEEGAYLGAQGWETDQFTWELEEEESEWSG